MHLVHKFSALLAILVAGAGSAIAGPLAIAPTMPPSDVAVGCVGGNTGPDQNFLISSCGATGLTLLYKHDTDSGVDPVPPLSGSYQTTLSPIGDESGGTITFTGGAYADCLSSSCWLVVKDGDANPGRYGFNLSSVWDGVSTITLSGFWAGVQGSISHVALFGIASDVCTEPNGCGPDRVPEPASLALVGIGLVGAALARRRRRQA